MYLYAKDIKISARQLELYLKDYDFDISHVQISKILGKYGLNRDKEIIKQQKETDNYLNDNIISEKEMKNDSFDDINDVFEQNDDENIKNSNNLDDSDGFDV